MPEDTVAPAAAPDPHHRITGVLREIERVWRRNPHKSLFQVLAKAATHRTRFDPFEITDRDVFDGLKAIAPGLPAPDWMPRTGE